MAIHGQRMIYCIAFAIQLCQAGYIVTEHNYTSMRNAMVDSQLRTSDVNDPRVIAAMLAVPRERFVPAGRRDVAYIDRPVKLADGRSLNPPVATGRLLVAADVQPTDNVLLVGAATGYAAALLAQLGGKVTALEEDAALAAQARDALAGVANVSVVEGPLNAGAAQAAPYDVILVDGAVELLPAALVDQLAEGGRLAVALAENGVTRLSIGRKDGGAFGMDSFADCETVPLPGFAKPKSFTF